MRLATFHGVEEHTPNCSGLMVLEGLGWLDFFKQLSGFAVVSASL